MASMSLLFWLRKDRISLSGEGVVCLRITIRGKRAEYTTGVRVAPDDWSVATHQVLGEGQAAADHNQLLKNLRAKALRVKDTMETAGQPVTAAAVAAALRQGVQATAVHVEPGPLFPPQPLTTTLTVSDDAAERNRRRGNTVAFQHNNLVRTPLRMGVLESRIFVEALRGINQGPDGDTTLPPIDIPLSAILRGDDSAEAYAAVRQACKDLFAKNINLQRVDSPKRDYHRTHIVSDIELATGEGRIRGNFAPLMQPYLLQLTTTGNFTRADIATLLTLSPNAQKLYWYLKSYANMGEGRRTAEHEISLADLKQLLLQDAGLYPVYAEFVRRVMEPIREEFNAPNVAFRATWEPLKTGKKVTGFRFTIPKLPRELPAAPVASGSALPTAKPDRFAGWLAGQTEQLQRAYAGLISSGKGGNRLAPAVAQRVVKHVAGHPEREATLYAIRYQVSTAKEPIKNRAAYTLKQLAAALGRDFA